MDVDHCHDTSVDTTDTSCVDTSTDTDILDTSSPHDDNIALKTPIFASSQEGEKMRMCVPPIGKGDMPLNAQLIQPPTHTMSIALHSSHNPSFSFSSSAPPRENSNHSSSSQPAGLMFKPPPSSILSKKQKFHSSNFPDANSLLLNPTKHARHSSSSDFLAEQQREERREYRGLDEEEEEERSHAEEANTSLFSSSHSSSLPSSFPSSSSCSIRLNVGGSIFQTTAGTLLKRPNTYFTARFSGRYHEKPSPFDNAYFIDRDGTHFRHLLNWLRDDELCVTDEDTLSQILREAEYYMLHELTVKVKNQLSDISLSRIKFENTSAPPPPLPLPPKISFMQSMLHGRSTNVKHQRNLNATGWGTGGMGGVGPTTVAAHTGLPTASLLCQPPHPPTMPMRTNSCPTQMHAAGGSSSSIGIGIAFHVAPHLQLHAPLPVALHQRSESYTHHHQLSQAGDMHAMNHEMEHEGTSVPSNDTATEPFVFSLQEDF
jgi:hypothetical protein